MRYYLVLFGVDMKTDKELLELAALAAGLNCKWFKLKKFSNVKSGGKVVGRMYSGYDEVFGTHHKNPWNQLTDDGDALRLAVKLKLDVTSDREDDCCSVWTYGNPDVNVKYGNDPYAATRRAIVRAAAAIGEKLCEI